MKILDILKLNRKSNGNLRNVTLQNNVSSVPKESIIDYLLGRGYSDLSAYVAIKYYGICAPLSDGIDRISREIGSITPLVYDTKSKEYIDEHPVLDLLKLPNADSTYTEYIEKYIHYFLLTGNSYNMTTGDIKKPPLELFNASPTAISIQQGTDGFADVFMMTGSNISQHYARQEIKRRFRYYNPANDQEMFQTKNFNPQGVLTALRGKSILNSIYYEIEQYINSSIHNLSNLKRGATLSGLLSTEEDLSILSDDQRENLKQMVNNYYGGSENAGRIGVLDKGMKFTSMQQNNKDMDFRELKNDTETTIYKRLGIPLPLVSEKTMTMTNLPASMLLFYDQAILPLANRIFSELTLLLMYRYKDSENLIIKYNPGDISALEPRRNEELQKIQSTNALTVNELRAKIGYEPIDDGDEIYQLNTLVPLGEGSILDDGSKMVTRDKFTELMELQVNSAGERRYTDEEIEGFADKEGL